MLVKSKNSIGRDCSSVNRTPAMVVPPVTVLCCERRIISERKRDKLNRIVLAPTCEHGGQSHVRSRCVSTRSHRRDYRNCRLATARDRPCQSHLHAPSVSALWSPGLSGQAVPADAARLGESRPVVSAGSRGHVFAAL